MHFPPSGTQRQPHIPSPIKVITRSCPLPTGPGLDHVVLIFPRSLPIAVYVPVFQGSFLFSLLLHIQQQLPLPRILLRLPLQKQSVWTSNASSRGLSFAVLCQNLRSPIKKQYRVG